MPKLRNGETDIEMFVQWLGRKCRNHNPLSELFKKDRARLPDRYKTNVMANVFVVEGDRSSLVYMAGDRVFAISVTEIDREQAQELQKKQRVEVGY